MITTITLNAAVDRNYVIDDFVKNGIFRCSDYNATAGGKGINVAKVLNILGSKVECQGFVGGYTGNFIVQNLKNMGIETNFVDIEGTTRSCFAIVSSDGSQTEVLEAGPKVTENEVSKFLLKYKETIKNTDIVVASGSAPRGVKEDIYCDLINVAHEENVKFILDTSTVFLKEGIKAKPFLIKPNKEELEMLLNKKIKHDRDVIDACKELISGGIKNIAVSLGSDGMIFVNDDCVYKVEVPKIEVVNPVGCGDSTVAGLAYALSQNYEIDEMLKIANACGIVNALHSETGYINLKMVNNIKDKIKVVKI